LTTPFKKIFPVRGAFKDRFALYSTDDDMMQGSWGIYSRFTRHISYLSNQKNDVNRNIERTSPLSPKIEIAGAKRVKKRDWLERCKVDGFLKSLQDFSELNVARIIVCVQNLTYEIGLFRNPSMSIKK
jgi:hypothetical protein